MTRVYPTYIYRNPLLAPQYLRSNHDRPQDRMEANVEGDFLLHAYIHRLDSETFRPLPQGLPLIGKTLWQANQLGALFTEMVDQTRIHGWALVSFYSPSSWIVLSEPQREDWIQDDSKQRIGVKVNYTDDLGNQFQERFLFKDSSVFLIRHEFDSFHFAKTDLSHALLDLVFNLRQIKGQMDFIGAKPGFKHYVYGDSIDETNAQELDLRLQEVDLTAGIGAPEGVLKEIRGIVDTTGQLLLPLYQNALQLFAGATRLPVSYFTGQNESGGLSDVGEKTALLKIDRKKQSLFTHYEPYIRTILQEYYGIQIDTTLTLPVEIGLDVIDNGQETQRID